MTRMTLAEVAFYRSRGDLSPYGQHQNRLCHPESFGPRLPAGWRHGGQMYRLFVESTLAYFASTEATVTVNGSGLLGGVAGKPRRLNVYYTYM